MFKPRKSQRFFRTLRARKLLVTKLSFFSRTYPWRIFWVVKSLNAMQALCRLIIQLPLCCRSEPLASWWLAVSILEPLLGADGADKEFQLDSISFITKITKGFLEEEQRQANNAELPFATLTLTWRGWKMNLLKAFSYWKWWIFQPAILVYWGENQSTSIRNK